MRGGMWIVERGSWIKECVELSFQRLDGLTVRRLDAPSTAPEAR